MFLKYQQVEVSLYHIADKLRGGLRIDAGQLLASLVFCARRWVTTRQIYSTIYEIRMYRPNTKLK